MFLNSRESRRGVAILIASNLQYTVNQEFRDTHCNIIALNITICNVQILLVGIYGPNSNDAAFFEFLRSVFSENRHLPIVCAGDWNTTYSTEPANSNIESGQVGWQSCMKNFFCLILSGPYTLTKKNSPLSQRQAKKTGRGLTFS
jgi:exonuclease III